MFGFKFATKYRPQKRFSEIEARYLNNRKSCFEVSPQTTIAHHLEGASLCFYGWFIALFGLRFCLWPNSRSIGSHSKSLYNWVAAKGIFQQSFFPNSVKFWFEFSPIYTFNFFYIIYQRLDKVLNLDRNKLYKRHFFFIFVINKFYMLVKILEGFKFLDICKNIKIFIFECYLLIRASGDAINQSINQYLLIQYYINLGMSKNLSD